MSFFEIFTNREKRTYLIRIFIIAFVLFYNSASAMYLYSFLPKMMVDFDVAENETLSGKYAAWMASGYFFARFLSSPFWGKFIDRSGRKRGLIMVLGAISTLTLLFGFAQNFWWALSIRLITGFINGLSIIGKVLTTEVCPDDMKAVSISIISTLWSLGMTVGPFFGSFFYEWIPGWPYLASAIAVSLFGFILMILSWIYLEETLDEKKTVAPKDPKAPVPLQDKGNFKYATLKEDEEEEKSADSLDKSEHTVDKTLEIESEGSTKDTTVVEVQTEQKDFASMNRVEQFFYLLKIPNVIPLIFIFSINTFYAAVYGELIPFWAAARYEDGGLAFSVKDISQIFVWLTAPQLLIQIFLYPFLQKRKGDFWVLTVGHFMHIILFLCIPYAHFFPKESMGSIKAYLVFWMFVRNLGSFMNFSALQRYTNDSITAQRRGQINGFQIACSSLFQTTGPILGAFVLSWSMEVARPYPFNYHFVFLVMVLITFITIYVIYKLDFVDKERKKLRGENGITA